MLSCILFVGRAGGPQTFEELLERELAASTARGSAKKQPPDSIAPTSSSQRKTPTADKRAVPAANMRGFNHLDEYEDEGEEELLEFKRIEESLQRSKLGSAAATTQQSFGGGDLLRSHNDQFDLYQKNDSHMFNDEEEWGELDEVPVFDGKSTSPARGGKATTNLAATLPCAGLRQQGEDISLFHLKPIASKLQPYTPAGSNFPHKKAVSFTDSVQQRELQKELAKERALYEGGGGGGKKQVSARRQQLQFEPEGGEGSGRYTDEDEYAYSEDEQKHGGPSISNKLHDQLNTSSDRYEEVEFDLDEEEEEQAALARAGPTQRAAKGRRGGGGGEYFSHQALDQSLEWADNPPPPTSALVSQFFPSSSSGKAGAANTKKTTAGSSNKSGGGAVGATKQPRAKTGKVSSSAAQVSTAKNAALAAQTGMSSTATGHDGGDSSSSKGYAGGSSEGRAGSWEEEDEDATGEGTDEMIGVHEKMKRLDTEIGHHYQETVKLKALRRQQQEELTHLRHENSAAKQRLAEQQMEFERYKEEQQRLLKKERRELDLQKRQLLKVPDRKERDTVDLLQEQIKQLKEEKSQRENKHRLTVDRMKKIMATLEADKNELSEQLRATEAQRLQLWKDMEDRLDSRAVGATAAAGGSKEQRISGQSRGGGNNSSKQVVTTMEASSTNMPIDASISHPAMTASSSSKAKHSSSPGRSSRAGHAAHASDIFVREEDIIDEVLEGGGSLDARKPGVESRKGGGGRDDRSTSSSQSSGSALSSVVVKELTHSGGRTETVFADGTRRIVFPNSTAKLILPDGSNRIDFPNGDKKETFPDGRVVYYYAAAETTHTAHKNGTQEYVFRINGIDQQSEIHFPDGRKEIVFADQTRKYLQPNGDCESIFKDGYVPVFLFSLSLSVLSRLFSSHVICSCFSVHDRQHSLFPVFLSRFSHYMQSYHSSIVLCKESWLVPPLSLCPTGPKKSTWMASSFAFILTGEPSKFPWTHSQLMLLRLPKSIILFPAYQIIIPTAIINILLLLLPLLLPHNLIRLRWHPPGLSRLLL